MSTSYLSVSQTCATDVTLRSEESLKGPNSILVFFDIEPELSGSDAYERDRRWKHENSSEEAFKQ